MKVIVNYIIVFLVSISSLLSFDILSKEREVEMIDIVKECEVLKENADNGDHKGYKKLTDCYFYGMLGNIGEINYKKIDYYLEMAVDTIDDDQSKLLLARSYMHYPSRNWLYDKSDKLLNKVKDKEQLQYKVLYCDAIISGKFSNSGNYDLTCLEEIIVHGNKPALYAYMENYKNNYHKGLDYKEEYLNLFYEEISDSESESLKGFLEMRCFFIPLELCDPVSAWE